LSNALHRRRALSLQSKGLTSTGAANGLPILQSDGTVDALKDCKKPRSFFSVESRFRHQEAHQGVSLSEATLSALPNFVTVDQPFRMRPIQLALGTAF
jgi:hypothetical protein